MALKQALGRALLRLIGWRLEYRPPPGPKGVMVVYPHTSNWDFPVGLFAKWAMGLYVVWMAKHTLFWWPLSIPLKWWGGLPVRRDMASGLVGGMVEQFRAAERLWVVITPEGTRSYRPHWKSGFYRVAMEANVPVALAFIDWGRSRVGVTEYLTLTGDVDADMARIAAVYAECRGKHPELAAPVRMAEPAQPVTRPGEP